MFRKILIVGLTLLRQPAYPYRQSHRQHQNDRIQPRSPLTVPAATLICCRAKVPKTLYLALCQVTLILLAWIPAWRVRL